MVDLGEGYKNDQACATFVEYIEREQQEILVRVPISAKFISLQADGNTDAENMEYKLFLALYFDTRRARYTFELHLFHMSDCPGMTCTCQIKLNDVLTLCRYRDNCRLQ